MRASCAAAASAAASLATCACCASHALVSRSISFLRESMYSMITSLSYKTPDGVTTGWTHGCSDRLHTSMSFMELLSNVRRSVPQPHSCQLFWPMNEEAARPVAAALRSAFEKNARSLLFLLCFPILGWPSSTRRRAAAVRRPWGGRRRHGDERLLSRTARLRRFLHTIHWLSVKAGAYPASSPIGTQRPLIMSLSNLHLSTLEPELRMIIYTLVVAHVGVLVNTRLTIHACLPPTSPCAKLTDTISPCVQWMRRCRCSGFAPSVGRSVHTKDPCELN